MALDKEEKVQVGVLIALPLMVGAGFGFIDPMLGLLMGFFISMWSAVGLFLLWMLELDYKKRIKQIRGGE